MYLSAFTVSFIYKQEHTTCSIDQTQKETGNSANGILKYPAGSENVERINFTGKRSRTSRAAETGWAAEQVVQGTGWTEE